MIARRKGFEILVGVVLYRLVGERMEVDCDGQGDATTDLTCRLGFDDFDDFDERPDRDLMFEDRVDGLRAAWLSSSRVAHLRHMNMFVNYSKLFPMIQTLET